MKTAEFNVLGGASLRRQGAAVTGMAARRHPMALLALLALSPEHTLSRSKLVGLLWPDSDESTGRNRLSSAVYPLRKALGADALKAAGDHLRLDPGAIDCDLWRFRGSLATQDYETAARLYTGPLLDGFYLDDSPFFEEHIEWQRRELEHAWHKALETLATRAQNEERHRDAAYWWQLLAASKPLDTSVARSLVESLNKAGTPHEALRAAEAHARALLEELGAPPEPDFLALLDGLKNKSRQTFQTPLQSIAVLLFDTAGDAESPTLAEGIHSGILNRLAQAKTVTAIARTSVLRYQGSKLRVSEIAKELGVHWVLEGELHARNNRIRIAVRLVDAKDERQVWSYDHFGTLDADNYFGVQAEIAEEIFRQLLHQLTPDERLSLAQDPTRSLEAHRLCTLGRMHLDSRAKESMEKALQCFEKALEHDEDYALAWVGLTDTLGLMFAYGYADASVLGRAGASINTALEKDPRCAEALAAFGRMQGQYKRHSQALQLLEQAVELKPGYAEAHNWLTVGRQLSGNMDGAMRSATRAVTLNPLSAEAVINLATSYLFSGSPEAALREAERALELQPDYDTATLFIALAHHELGDHGSAFNALKGVHLPWVGAGVDTVRALALCGQGKTKRALEVLETVGSHGYPFDEGLVLAALGQKEPALKAFDRARFQGIEMADSYWPVVVTRYLFRPLWNSLSDDVRYRDMLERLESSLDARVEGQAAN